MFGWFKKDNKEIISIESEVLGIVELKSEGWECAIKYVFGGREYNIPVNLVQDDFDVFNKDAFEGLYKQYSSNKEDLDKKIVNELVKHYELKDENAAYSRFEPKWLYLFENGSSGLTFLDKEIDEGWSDQYIVVEITPELCWYGPEEEYI